MKLNVMVVFDIVIGVLGICLFVRGLIYMKKKELDAMLISAEELVSCRDKEGLVKYLMPKSILFGLFCFIFGLVGLCYDMKYIAFSKVIYAGFLIAFLLAWGLFSYHIKKAKEKFIH